MTRRKPFSGNLGRRASSSASCLTLRSYGKLDASLSGFYSSENAWTAAILSSLRESLRCSRGQKLVVFAFLAFQAGLLVSAAMQNSPTHLEPAFLAAGVDHWKQGRFDLYNVNPPLVKCIGAIPAVFLQALSPPPAAEAGRRRLEFIIGLEFVKLNGEATLYMLLLGRLMCIPFALAGAYCAYLWATELYGVSSGTTALAVYVTEPNLLAVGSLLTPDSACCSFFVVSGYTFWKWLKRPTWKSAICAAVALGIAQLTKMSCLLLLVIWPSLFVILWMQSVRKARHRLTGNYASIGVPKPDRSWHSRFRQPIQLLAMICLSVYIINVGYGFDGSFQRLSEYEFTCSSLTGFDETGRPGNRFAKSVVGSVCIPLPRDYVIGLDRQKKDLESYPELSYLRGEWRDGGWLWYYAYGLIVKTQVSSWCLLTLILLSRLLNAHAKPLLRSEFVLLVPAIALFLIVSINTELNRHLRYSFPCIALTTVFLGQSARAFERFPGFRVFILVGLLTTYSAWVAISTSPHFISYFNEFVGGSNQGEKHLLGSSFDWGQDFLQTLRAIKSGDPNAKIVYIASNPYPAKDVGFDAEHADVSWCRSIIAKIIANPTLDIAGRHTYIAISKAESLDIASPFHGAMEVAQFIVDSGYGRWHERQLTTIGSTFRVLELVQLSGESGAN